MQIGAPGRDRTGDISLTSSVHRVRTHPATAARSDLRPCQHSSACCRPAALLSALLSTGVPLATEADFPSDGMGAQPANCCRSGAARVGRTVPHRVATRSG
jgi:hypothetical protein